jgi:hypothetical protein
MEFVPRPDCKYKYDYEAIFRDIAQGELPEKETFRSLILNDLWFIVYFIMEIPVANHPFVVNQCKVVEEGPKSHTLDVWAREHFKSTIITTAETVQAILRNPECTTAIFSFKKPAADKFLDAIRKTLEKETLIKLFPEILYEKPDTQAPVWSLQSGIRVKRRSTSRRENTVEAFGLVEGMPTGGHYDRRIYDDIETADLAKSPDQLNMCFSQLEYSEFLGVDGGIVRIIGTYYNHAGPLVRIQNKKDKEGNFIYTTRVVPGSDDGTASGKPVLVSAQRWRELQAGEHFNQQILCDPTPAYDRNLASEYLRPIERRFIPNDLLKFMLIDPAGDQSTQSGEDSWAMGVFGVERSSDEIGASNVYILDLEISPHKHSDAIEAATRMYLRNGVIQALAIEKVGQSTAEIHVANALRAANRSVSVETGSLIILKPQGRKKEDRIVSALQWPLNNNKWFYAADVEISYVARLKDEMDKFPFWHDDGLDICAYLYDILKDYRFSRPRKLEPLPYPKVGVV